MKQLQGMEPWQFTSGCNVANLRVQPYRPVCSTGNVKEDAKEEDRGLWGLNIKFPWMKKK